MERMHKKLYTLWLLVSFGICSFLLIFSYPDYANTEFPLYTDFRLIVFLPAFFIFAYLLSHMISVAIGSRKNISKNIIFLIKFSLIFISFIFSWTFMEFRWEVRIISSVVFFIVSIPHFAITEILHSKIL